MLHVDEITSQSEFLALEADWRLLLQSTGQPSIFLSHDWFRCCLGAYADEKKLFVLRVRDAGRTVGIAPMWRYRDTVRTLPVRRIGFISAPDTALADFIVQHDRRLEVIGAVLHYLHAQRRDIWDVLTLTQWPTDSPNCAALLDILRAQRARFFLGVSTMTPYLPIEGDWEKFLNTRSPRFRKTHRNVINRMEKLPNVEVQCFHQDPAGTALEDILRVSGKSWKQEQNIALGNRGETRRFFEVLTDLAARRGWLLLWLLKVDGLPIAMEYDLEHDGKVYALRADYDEAYREYSPGAYLEYQILKHFFQKGYVGYSFGPGLNPYKLHWTEALLENVELHLCNANLKGSTIWGLEVGLVPFFRRIREAATNPA